MVSRTVPVLLALLAALGAVAEEPRSIGSVEELLVALEDAHAFTYELCDETGGYEARLCGTYERDAQGPRNGLERMLGARAAPSAWKHRKRFSSLRFELGKREIDLRLREDRRQLDVTFRPVLPDCGDDPRIARQERLRGNPDPDYAPPERTEYVRPYYPRRARAERADGEIRLLATITTEGRLIDACALDVSHRGLGFETSAVLALLQWRYRPATRSGETVAVPDVFTLRWTVY